MRILKYLLLLILPFGCSNPDHANEQSPKADTASLKKEEPAASTIKTEAKSSDFYVSISVPQNSGLAFVAYKSYVVEGDSLYILIKNPGDKSSKVFEKHFIDPNKLKKLKKAVAAVDSIGYQAGSCDIYFGLTRFYIYFDDNGRKGDGFVANVYRKTIFTIIDAMNEIHPNEKVIDYDKKELIQGEKDCEKKFKQLLSKHT